jgi:hypothetical protein
MLVVIGLVHLDGGEVLSTVMATLGLVCNHPVKWINTSSGLQAGVESNVECVACCSIQIRATAAEHMTYGY